MLQSRGDENLAAKALDVDASDEFGREDFYDDVAAQRSVVRDVDAGHSAAAELAVDRITGAERVLDLLAELGHEQRRSTGAYR